MKLVILGNGFDCAHNLRSQYSVFKRYIKKNDQAEYDFLSHLFGEDFETDEFWWNFEESLAKANFENFSEDLEVINDHQRKNGFEDEDCVEYDNNYFETHISKLKTLFCQWIYEINSDELQYVTPKDNVSQFLEDSLILSFNYTGTVEEIYGKECYHIHGYIEEIDIENSIGIDSIILGHSRNIVFISNDGKEIPDDNVCFVSSNELDPDIPCSDVDFIKDYHCSNNENINEILSHSDANYEHIFTKRSASIIMEDYTGFFEKLKCQASSIDEVIVLGHSLAEVDQKYFRKIAEILSSNGKPIKWTVSFYDEGSKKDLAKNLSEIDKKAVPIFITIN